MITLEHEIVEKLGGAGNINSLTHCATRLRFDIKDHSLIDEAALKSRKEILGVINKGGQYQIVIGPTVEQVYNKIIPLLNQGADEAVQAGSKAQPGSGISGSAQTTGRKERGGKFNEVLAISPGQYLLRFRYL